MSGWIIKPAMIGKNSTSCTMKGHFCVRNCGELLGVWFVQPLLILRVHSLSYCYSIRV